MYLAFLDSVWSESSETSRSVVPVRLADVSPTHGQPSPPIFTPSDVGVIREAANLLPAGGSTSDHLHDLADRMKEWVTQQMGRENVPWISLQSNTIP